MTFIPIAVIERQKKLQARYWIATRKGERLPICAGILSKKTPGEILDCDIRSRHSAAFCGWSKKTPGEILDCDTAFLAPAPTVSDAVVKKNSRRDTGLRHLREGRGPTLRLLLSKKTPGEILDCDGGNSKKQKAKRKKQKKARPI